MVSTFHGFCVVLVAVLAFVVYNLPHNDNARVLLSTAIPYPLKSYYNSYFKLYSQEELKYFDGSIDRPIYISILGTVFDVTKGSKHYSPGAPYHGFAGRDATRSFVTGDFTPSGLTSNIDGLTLNDLLSIQKWLEHYHKEYIFKGNAIGRYYDALGYKTKYLHQFYENLDAAKVTKELEAAENIKYPPCNYEWNQDTGSSVWCSPESGGIKRDWAGVPRMLFEAGTTKHKCVCVALDSEEVNKKNIRIYEGCNPQAERCKVLS